MCRTVRELEIAVLKVNPSAPAVCGEADLDRGRAGWQVVGAGVAQLMTSRCGGSRSR
jgi:hypothetical protein